MDRFIEIAQQKIHASDAELVRPEPIPFEKKPCVLESAATAPFPVKTKAQTKEEIYAEVAKLRKHYDCYLQNHAPAFKRHNTRIDIREFVLDGKERITIPYYGGPVGYGLQTYETTFTLGDFTDQEVYICFKGADYIAKVYINGECVGIHEGFFSPFEFNVTLAAREGENTLKVVLENDFIYQGNGVRGYAGEKAGDARIQGDKLYAATGLGFDESFAGWHHCPPGMGIYNDVFVEIREKVNITDMFVRPCIDDHLAELWIEVDSTEYKEKSLVFDLSLYGQNFCETVFEHRQITPVFDGHEIPAEHGKNLYKLPIPMENFKLWDLETPFLYQLQVKVFYEDKLQDTGKVSFGMRSFSQDTESTPKGMFYLNGKKTRLRGANTMGFEQQDVLKGDFEQLITDILLAKVCNMNFWRLTQRPVQDEIYEYCDMLGLMTQTDLPLFRVMRRNKFCEGVRQTEEMTKMVRKHPCNIMLTYMNEPIDIEFPPYRVHRHLIRAELEDFFRACDLVVKLNHPDCVIKHIDGDCKSPDNTEENCMPDVHAYTMWYNGHCISFGELHRGYWDKVKPGWFYGCGEYGTEGLDYADLMRRRYPKEWLKEPFDPANIVAAQAKGCHVSFFDTPETLEEWVEASQSHQAFATRYMTEAFRRDPRMVSFAIHLFIDAWPSGWMKTIMDCERTPKPAFYEYKNALEPLMVSLRTDRFTYFSGETVSIEAYVCNDTHKADEGHYSMVFELYDGEKLIMTKMCPASFGAATTTYVASAEFTAEHVSDRAQRTLRAILVKDGVACTHNDFTFEIFKKRTVPKNDDVVLITDLEIGEHEIAGETVKVESGFSSCDYRIFVSRDTGHPAVAEFREKDFSLWYDKKKDRISHITEKKFTAEGFVPILSFKHYAKSMVAGVKEHEGKKYVICLADLRTENPVAERFLENLYQL